MENYYGDDDFASDRFEADLQQGELERAGRITSRLRKKGICLHGWLQGTPGEGENGPHKCLHCGAQFPSFAASQELAKEYL